MSTRLVGLILAIVLALVYGQIGWHQLVNFDDPAYLYENSHVRAGLTAAGWHWAWLNKDVGMWHPVTWLAHMLVHDIGGGRPGVHLLANLFCHWVNAGLLFIILRRSTRSVGPSFAVALLFALHPGNVETVAWASQLKSTLSTTFLFGTLWAYVAYVQGGGRKAYLLAVGSAALGLMTKPMLVSLPLLLLLLDFWPLVRIPGVRAKPDAVPWKRLLWEKVPFGLLALVGVVLTLMPWGPLRALSPVSSIAEQMIPWARMATAPLNYLRYLGLLFHPGDLAVFYPPLPPDGLGPIGGAIILLAIISIMVWRYRGACPALFFGWGWFVVALLPVSGVLVIGPHDWADRYLYVPGVGIFIAMVWLVRTHASDFIQRWSGVLLGAVVAIFALQTFVQVRYWRNSLTLWQHAVAVTSPTALGHINLGNAWLAAGQEIAAAQEFNAAIRLSPANPRPYTNLAVMAQKHGDATEAVRLLRIATQLAPDDPRILSNLGSLLHDQGQVAEARQLLEQAVVLRPDLAEAHTNLGVLLAGLGALDEARPHFAEAVRLNPRDAVAQHNLEIVSRALPETVPGR